VASFGENLRQARESRKITLQEIAETTKIGTRALQALESNRFDQLPGGIFNKGFVRSYARVVGLDEEKTVAAYVAAANVGDPEVDMQTLSSQVVETRSAGREPLNGGTVVGVLAVLVALGMGALWLNEHRKEAREAAAEHKVETQVAVASAPAPPTSAVVAPDPAPNASQSPSPDSTVAPTQNPAPNTNQPEEKTSTSPIASKQNTSPVEVSISATSKAWISVRSDGKAVESLTLDPDKPESRSRSYSAQEKLLLVIGNPAGLSVTYNGKPAGSLGEEGHRATITFTPEGMEKR